MAQLERYSLILTLCEPFSLFRQIIDNLFLCDNLLHKLEILYSSLTRLCFKRNPTESRAQIWRHNGDDALSSIILAGHGILVKMLITLNGMLYMYFDKKKIILILDTGIK